MAETLVIVSLPPLIALMGVILKVIVGLRNENRNDHGDCCCENLMRLLRGMTSCGPIFVM
jgi:hypothetical protein